MKRISLWLTLLIIFLFIMWRSNCLASIPYLDNLNSKITIERVLKKNNIYDLESYGKWLLTNIYYKDDTDTIYSWARPEETLAKGYGDCEDFAFLSKEVLTTLGYKAFVIGLLNKEYGHAICLVRYSNQWTIFDNNTFFHTNLRSDKEIIRLLKDQYKFIFIKELNYERTF